MAIDDARLFLASKLFATGKTLRFKSSHGLQKECVLFFLAGAVVVVVAVAEVGVAIVVVVAVTVRSVQQWYIIISNREQLAESYKSPSVLMVRPQRDCSILASILSLFTQFRRKS